MEKLKLNVDELRIEGFATSTHDEQREGTVLAHVATIRCTAGSCGMVCP